jgi:hypothetical protein
MTANHNLGQDAFQLPDSQQKRLNRHFQIQYFFILIDNYIVTFQQCLGVRFRNLAPRLDGRERQLSLLFLLFLMKKKDASHEGASAHAAH